MNPMLQSMSDLDLKWASSLKSELTSTRLRYAPEKMSFIVGIRHVSGTTAGAVIKIKGRTRTTVPLICSKPSKVFSVLHISCYSMYYVTRLNWHMQGLI